MKHSASVTWGVLLLATSLFTVAFNQGVAATSTSSIEINLKFPLPEDKLWVVNTYPNHHWGAKNCEWEYAADFYYADNQNDPNSCAFGKGGGVNTPVYAACSGKLRVQVRDAKKDVSNFSGEYRYYFC